MINHFAISLFLTTFRPFLTRDGGDLDMRLVIAGKTWEALYTDLALSTVHPWIEPVQVLSVLTCAVTMLLLCGCYVVAVL